MCHELSTMDSPAVDNENVDELAQILLQIALGVGNDEANQSPFKTLPLDVVVKHIKPAVKAVFMQNLREAGRLTPLQNEHNRSTPNVAAGPPPLVRRPMVKRPNLNH